MFRKLTDRIASAMGGGGGSASGNSADDGGVRVLMSMGFDRESASQALSATGGNVDQAAELLLAAGGGGGGGGGVPQHQQTRATGFGMPPAAPAGAGAAAASNASSSWQREEEELQRALQASMDLQQHQGGSSAAAYASSGPQSRTAAMQKAAHAAAQRAEKSDKQRNGFKRKSSSTSTSSSTGAASSLAPRKLGAQNGGLAETHPEVKVIKKLQDKPKTEQVLRCADRLKASPRAVDTLYRALTALRNDPDNAKFRKLDKTSAGYQRSVANAPGAEDLLFAMNYRHDGNRAMVLDRAMVDPALLYMGISALEQTKLTAEYKEAKRKEAFAKAVSEIQMSANSSEAEAVRRAACMAKCPSEPSGGAGALMQVLMADQTVRRRFDGDDTLADVLNWLGGHGSVIPEKIISREWSLVDLNRYPLAPIDCASNQHHTIQYVGFWPSGRLEIIPSTEEWMSGGSSASSTAPGSAPSSGNGTTLKLGSSRGLGSAPSDAL